MMLMAALEIILQAGEIGSDRSQRLTCNQIGTRDAYMS